MRIKGKVEQSCEWSSAFSYTISSYWKGSLRVTLDYGCQLTYMCVCACVCVCVCVCAFMCLNCHLLSTGKHSQDVLLYLKHFDLYVCVRVCACGWVWLDRIDTLYLALLFLIHSRLPYESFDFWMEWILECIVFFPHTFGSNWSYLRENE